jgi:hypothetical protein
MVAPVTDAGPTLWVSPTAPGRAPANTEGTSAQIIAARHIWEAHLGGGSSNLSHIHLRATSFKKIKSSIFLIDHLFTTYGNITAVDLENNFEHMRLAWDPQQPVESLFKQIQDCADYSEAGGVLIGHTQQINVGYANIFSTGHFIFACRQWNKKPLIDKTWAQFKAHFSAAHRQHKQLQGESAATSCYHVSNAAVEKRDQMAEATVGALANIATATTSDRGIVPTLTEANARLVRQLEENSNELRELKALIKKERIEK